MSKFLILIKASSGNPKAFYLDNIVLEGNENDLYEKMTDIDFVKSIGVPESYWFEEFALAKKDNILFPADDC